MYADKARIKGSDKRCFYLKFPKMLMLITKLYWKCMSGEVCRTKWCHVKVNLIKIFLFLLVRLPIPVPASTWFIVNNTFNTGHLFCNVFMKSSNSVLFCVRVSNEYLIFLGQVMLIKWLEMEGIWRLTCPLGTQGSVTCVKLKVNVYFSF